MIKHRAQAGSLESSDLLVVVDKFSIKDVNVLIEDKGALQPTICARMETAILRSMDQQEGTMS